ncbi:hypothetical protein SNEBB_010023 [Seison nebaliae]|nr:hypothetical protein SNEBB_010023 [Seison nebaliae]
MLSKCLRFIPRHNLIIQRMKSSTDLSHLKWYQKLVHPKHRWKTSLVGMALYLGLSGSVIIWSWGSPHYDEKGQEIMDMYTDSGVLMSRVHRTANEVRRYIDDIQAPSSQKLLPDELKPPYTQPKYTLIIEPKHLLIEPKWSAAQGWRHRKRAYVDEFLKAVGYPEFEVVFFTDEPMMSGRNAIHALNEQSHAAIADLYRESTRYINGSHVKDLDCINRDPSKVIVLDVNEKNFQLHSRNGLKRLPEWTDNPNDRTLLVLAAFLKMIQKDDLDVRTVLDYYNKEVDPLQSFEELLRKRKQHFSQTQQKQQQSKSFNFFSANKN